MAQRVYRERYARLTQVADVGEAVATTFLAEIFAPERFNRADEVAPYLARVGILDADGG